MTNDGNAILREVKTASVCLSVRHVCLFQPVCVSPHLQIQVQHPAAKSMIEISRTQDEEVGDGTTSVIILGENTAPLWPPPPSPPSLSVNKVHVFVCVCVRTAGELLSVAEQFLEQQMHPTVVISAYRQALDHILEALRDIR